MDIIAVVALILSLSSLGWQCFTWWHSQARIEIQVSKGKIVDGLGNSDNKEKLFIKVINHGDKDIIIHQIFMKHKENGFLYLQEPIAKLEARNCHTVFRNLEYISDAKVPYEVFVVDATGKKYASKPISSE